MNKVGIEWPFGDLAAEAASNQSHPLFQGHWSCDIACNACPHGDSAVEGCVPIIVENPLDRRFKDCSASVCKDEFDACSANAQCELEHVFEAFWEGHQDSTLLTFQATMSCLDEKEHHIEECAMYWARFSQHYSKESSSGQSGSGQPFAEPGFDIALEARNLMVSAGVSTAQANAIIESLFAIREQLEGLVMANGTPDMKKLFENDIVVQAMKDADDLDVGAVQAAASEFVATDFCTDYESKCGNAGFDDTAQCKTWYAGADDGVVGATSGATKACYQYHLSLAANTASEGFHCPHAKGTAVCVDQSQTGGASAISAATAVVGAGLIAALY
jgi:hypothetical protein